MLALLKEENENLKKKIVDMSNMLKSEQQRVQNLSSNGVNLKLKETEKKVGGLEALLQEKDEQIEALKIITNEYAEFKGK